MIASFLHKIEPSLFIQLCRLKVFEKWDIYDNGLILSAFYQRNFKNDRSTLSTESFTICFFLCREYDYYQSKNFKKAQYSYTVLCFRSLTVF